MKEKIIIYGSGYIPQKSYPRICEKYDPVCFVEHPFENQGGQLFGLPVLTQEQALKEYPKAGILISVPYAMRYDIIDQLIEKGVAVNRIIGAKGPAEKRWGCAYLEQFVIFWKDEMRLCCSLITTYLLPFKTKYVNSPKENIDNYIAENEKFVSGIQDSELRNKYCGDCSQLRYGNWVKFDSFYKMSISIESPCNYKCLYCASGDGVYQGHALDDGTSMRHALDFIDYCRKSGRLDDYANFWVSAGEPALHPMIEEFVNIAKGHFCSIPTNASVYSEPIAQLLKGGMSQIRVSMDAGTPETYAKARGVNESMYKKVCSNLAKYAAIGEGVVELQYLILPGLNTNAVDVEGFCKLAKEIGTKRVLITRDRNKIGNIDADAAHAIALLKYRISNMGIKARLLSEVSLSFEDAELARIKAAERALAEG